MYDFLKSSNQLPRHHSEIAEKDIKQTVKLASKNRPKSNELIDQCPISDDDLVIRVKLILDYLKPIEDKKILFVGDDDLASAVIGKLSKVYISLIDIDEQILEISKRAVLNKSSIFLEANILDIVDKVSKDPVTGTFDAFVTDPPYTEMGYRYFLTYGIKHLNIGGMAFIAVPYMNEENWSSELLYKVQEFLIKNGFVLIEIIPGFAEYVHEDEVISTMVIAKKVSTTHVEQKDLKRSKTYTTSFEL